MTTPNLGLSLTSESAGSAVTFLDWRLLQDGTLSSNTLIIDTAYGELSGSISGISGSLVTGGDSHNHDGGDGGTIAHASLSGSGTNTHANIDSFIASKGALGGLAQLSATGSVVENPANATATRTASKIPISNASGNLDKWITHRIKGTIVNPADIYPSASRIVLMKADETVYITNLHLSTNTSSATFDASLVYATNTQDFSGVTSIVACDTTGTFTTTSSSGSVVSSGSYIALQMDSLPSATIKQVFFEMLYLTAA